AVPPRSTRRAGSARRERDSPPLEARGQAGDSSVQSEQSPSGYMKPQFGQGFLHPHALGGTSTPQRRQVGRGLAVAVGAREEGIGAALVSDGGLRSMAAVHDGRIGQRKQLALDTREQRVEVAPRKVRSTDRSQKQHVAAERDALAFERDTPGRVPG